MLRADRAFCKDSAAGPIPPSWRVRAWDLAMQQPSRQIILATDHPKTMSISPAVFYLDSADDIDLLPAFVQM